MRSYKVIIEHQGQSTELDVDPDETIRSKALDSGLSIPYDCNLGVYMTCPAKLVSGKVYQSEGMLSDDVVKRDLHCCVHPIRGRIVTSGPYPKRNCRQCN